MSTLKTSPSHSPGKRKPYFMVREKRSQTKEQLIENLNNKSSEYNPSKATSRTTSTKGTLIYKTNPKQDSDTETVSDIQKNLQKKFYTNMIENCSSNTPSKTSKLSSGMKYTSRIITESDVNQSKNLSINPNLTSNLTAIVSPKSQTNFSSRAPVTENEFMKSLSPRYVINSIYSYNYLSRKSPTKGDREKLFAGNARSTNKSPTSGSTTNRHPSSKQSSRPAVFDRLYDEKSVTQRYDNSKVLGVKDILQNAQASLNRMTGRPSFDGINILTEDTDRKYSVPQQAPNGHHNNEKILDERYMRAKAATPDIASLQRSPQANGLIPKSSNYNFSFGGDARNYNRYTQQQLAKIGYDKQTGSFGRGNQREFPPDPAELIYSSPKSNEKPAYQPKYFENSSKSSAQKMNPAFSYVSGTAESQYYRQPAVKK